MKKVIGIIMGILGVMATAIGIMWKVKEHKMSVNGISIIGGADGPTSIFIVGKFGGNFWAYSIIIGIIVLIVAGVILFKHKH